MITINKKKLHILMNKGQLLLKPQDNGSFSNLELEQDILVFRIVPKIRKVPLKIT